jgi:uncharacterized damage-inducible protein DinB
MQFNLEQAINVLERTPQVLQALLSSLPTNWTKSNEGGDSWSVYDIIGHLIHGEKTDWITRAQLILQQTNTPFTPFDRFAQFNDSKGKSLEELLEQFTLLRQANIKALKALNLEEDQLQLEGIHPDFGRVTLKELLATWTVHDLNHIAQIVRVMGHQYKEEVGPWKAYLSLLQERKA